ncbi:MAG: PQQ-binding-like beta-propeller repeat protein [Thermoanaerobaculia bacterium]
MALLLPVLGCPSGPREPASDAAAALESLPASSTDAEALDAVARRLAGLEASSDPLWAEHAEAMAAIWAELDERHLQPMRSWAETALADVADPGARLFYPFGGPDLLSAMQFFPAASSYVLVGLEPPGKIPSLEDFPPAALDAELARLRGGLDHLLDAGYFVTKRMEKDFAPADNRLDGFLPVLFLFLARGGHSPVAVRYLDLDADGGMRYLTQVTAETARAVEIELRPQEGTAAAGRRVYYFAQDLSDGGLAESPELLRWLSPRDGFNVYMKSASYLLHMPEFTTLRAHVLAGAKTVLQDDSGVPLRFFDAEDWRLSFHGVYRQTLPTYREWFQEDLRAAYTSDPGIAPLPFAIGYNSRVAGSCLIRADRRPRPWAQFRGPTGDGLAPLADLPVAWSEDDNVTWKTEIPGRGWSSPVVSEGKIWLTTAVDDERSLRAVAVAADSGEILHDVEVFQPASWRSKHAENSFASPTPVAEKGRVYVHYGAYGTACLSADGGRPLWKIQAFDFDHEHGPGSSPILFGDLLILSFDGARERFVAAYDKNTGELAWKTPRSVKLDHHLYAFTTPLVIEHDGRAQLVSPGAGQTSAYDPRTGEEIWNVRYEGHSNVSRPVAGLGRVFVNTGYMKPHLLAIRPDGHGDVTDSHVMWDYRWQVPANPSPLLIGDRLFFVSDRGNATWLDARRGEDVWRQRLGGRHYASPIAAGGRIYTFSTEGEIRVIAAEDEFRELAKNQVDGAIRASPAVVGDALILRTDRHLYRIEKPASAEG